MEMKPISFEDALALYDEEPTGEATAQPIENPENVFDSDEAQAQPIEEPTKVYEGE